MLVTSPFGGHMQRLCVFVTGPVVHSVGTFTSLWTEKLLSFLISAFKAKQLSQGKLIFMAVEKGVISFTQREISLPNMHYHCRIMFLCLYRTSVYLSPTCTFGGSCLWQLLLWKMEFISWNDNCISSMYQLIEFVLVSLLNCKGCVL